MKKTIITFLFLLGISAGLSAQNLTFEYGGKSSVQQLSAQTIKFPITVTGQTSTSDLTAFEQKMESFQDVSSVDFTDLQNGVGFIVMTKVSEMSMLKYLHAAGIENVKVDGQDYQIRDYIDHLNGK